MNDVANKKSSYLVLFVLGVLIGSGAIFAIAQRQYNKSLDNLSKQLTASKAANSRLADDNNRLIKNNRDDQNTIGRLQQSVSSLTRTNSQLKSQLNGVTGALGKISEGLSSSTDALQSVIDGLEEVKSLIRALP